MAMPRAGAFTAGQPELTRTVRNCPPRTESEIGASESMKLAQSATPSASVSVSGEPQPQAPGAIFAGSFGHWSLQSEVPSESVSVSATPQPQTPGTIFAGSLGHWSLQSAVPSESVSVSAVPQPQTPGAILAASVGQPSFEVVVNPAGADDSQLRIESLASPAPSASESRKYVTWLMRSPFAGHWSFEFAEKPSSTVQESTDAAASPAPSASTSA